MRIKLKYMFCKSCLMYGAKLGPDVKRFLPFLRAYSLRLAESHIFSKLALICLYLHGTQSVLMAKKELYIIDWFHICFENATFCKLWCTGFIFCPKLVTMAGIRKTLFTSATLTLICHQESGAALGRSRQHRIHQTAAAQLSAQHLQQAVAGRTRRRRRSVDTQQMWQHCSVTFLTSHIFILDILDEDKFNVELVVQCIRASDMPQTHHHALLLLGTVAAIFPVSDVTSCSLPCLS